MKKFLIAFCIGFSCSLFAAPYVTNVVAKQRYPWGIVDISCEVCGIEEKVKNLEFTIDAVSSNLGVTNKASHVYFRGEKTRLEVTTNGIYRFVWDANKDMGSSHNNNMIILVSIIHEKVQLWDGGPYWSITNIGADKPEDYGYYFWWGDTIGYKRENDKWVACDGSNSNFLFLRKTTPTQGKGISTLQSEGWITAEGVLTPEHDAAQVHWGGKWRMPTKQEFDDLVNNCDWLWTTMNGVAGYVVRGRGDYAANSIFLPCAGNGSDALFFEAGSYGYYWSSVPYPRDYGRPNDNGAWSLEFDSGYHYTYYKERYYGLPVRPLQGFTK
jgi:hypothetical protein